MSHVRRALSTHFRRRPLTDILELRPAIRDALIIHLRDWVTALTESGLSVNWPYGLDAAIEKHPDTSETRLTEAFIEHAFDYNNWSVSSKILATFPELDGEIQFHDVPGLQQS